MHLHDALIFQAQDPQIIPLQPHAGSVVCRLSHRTYILPSPSSDLLQNKQWVSLRQRDIADLDILVAPLVEELDAANLGDNFLWQNLVARDGLDFNISVVRHDGDG
jgi:hypothetical protein